MILNLARARQGREIVLNIDTEDCLSPSRRFQTDDSMTISTRGEKRFYFRHTIDCQSDTKM